VNLSNDNLKVRKRLNIWFYTQHNWDFLVNIHMTFTCILYGSMLYNFCEILSKYNCLVYHINMWN